MQLLLTVNFLALKYKNAMNVVLVAIDSTGDMISEMAVVVSKVWICSNRFMITKCVANIILTQVIFFTVELVLPICEEFAQM